MSISPKLCVKCKTLVLAKGVQDAMRDLREAIRLENDAAQELRTERLAVLRSKLETAASQYADALTVAQRHEDVLLHGAEYDLDDGETTPRGARPSRRPQETNADGPMAGGAEIVRQRGE